MRSREQSAARNNREDGYLLLGAIVAIALVMIALSVAAVKVSFALRREREVESARRADQYVRAIRRFYLKFGRYPGSVEQLENTNNIRFLRQKYIDPLTGKPDYRLIILGQNKTQPTGFFGEPLGGLPGSGPGASAGAGAAQQSGAATNGFGAGSATNNGAGGIGASTPGASGNGNTATMGFGGSNNAATAVGPQSAGQGTAATPGAGTNSTSTPGLSPQSSTGPGSSSGPIMGVGSSASGNAILAVNNQTTYQTWEFLYDPRVERLRQAGQINQGAQSGNGNSNPAGLGAGAPTGPAGATGTGSNLPGSGSPTPPPANATQPTQP